RNTLSARTTLFDSLIPETKYYTRIKEMVADENVYQAAPLLAKYQKQIDVPFIIKLLQSPHSDQQYYGIRSVIHFPESVFFQELKRIISEADNNDRDLRLALYSALVQYKNTESKKILERELHQIKGWELAVRTDLIYQALRAYPDSVYLGLIKLDFFKSGT